MEHSHWEKIAVLRLSLMIFAISVRVFDYIVEGNCPDRSKYYKGSDTYAGRLKSLTYITMWINVFYFSFAFIVDLTPGTVCRKKMRLFSDWFFTTICWTVSLYTVIFFWTIALYDRELIHPTYLEDYLPINGFSNHGLHTVPLIITTVECLLIEHTHPSHHVAGVSVFGAGLSYTIWNFIIKYNTGEWAYSSMKNNYFTPLVFVIYSAFSTMCGGLFYLIGRELSRHIKPKVKGS